MKPIYSYILTILVMLLLIGLLGVFVLVATSGAGIRAYILTMRYMSLGGKVALALSGTGAIFFLVKFIFATEKK